MNVVKERFIELAVIQRFRKLSQEEEREFAESYRVLVKNYLPIIEKEWEKSKIRKLMYLAYETKDVPWILELYDRLKKIEKGETK